jgi:flagellar biosynthesis protein FlhA
MELELGLQLIRLADSSRGGDLLAQITEARRRVAADLGIVLPRIRIRDNLQLDRRDYRIKIAGSPVARGTAHPGRVLALGGEGIERLQGIEAPSSPSLCAAAWIEVEQLDAARACGCTILEPAAAIAAHVQRVAREHAAELLTRDATRHLVEETRNTAPAVVEELVPGVLKLGEVQRVLQRLLEEGVPLRPLGAILEAIGDHAHETRDPAQLAEHARRRLARMLSTRFRDARQILRAVTLDAALEEQLASSLPREGESLASRLPPQSITSLAEEIALGVRPLVASGYPPLLLTGPTIRAALKQWTASVLPELIVLSYDELTRDTRVESWHAVGRTAAKAA